MPHTARHRRSFVCALGIALQRALPSAAGSCLRSQAEVPAAGGARRAERRVLVASMWAVVAAMPGTSPSVQKPRVRLAAAQGSGDCATLAKKKSAETADSELALGPLDPPPSCPLAR